MLGKMPLMVLLALLGGLQESSGAQQEMLCTPNACFVLHMEPVRFHKAQNRCEDDGGYLLTVRASDEQEALLSLLSLIEKQQGEPALRFWIGLKLSRGECVRPDRTLRGFRWISGGEDSQFSNWKREPVSTCTEERCVTVDYSFSGQEQLRWTPAGCRMKASYVCKFYFQGMCEALTLLGPGKIIYEAVFSKHPLKSELQLLPFGTRARIFCGAQELATSLCRSKDGAYSWTDPGPFCKPGSRSCARSNGGCEHECRQEGEAVRCSCREGYELDGDGFSCRREDLCRAAACQHRCVTEETGFSCKCPSGFQLKENRRDCSDVDECREQACGDHGCINTDGGYRCECRPGYLLSHGECRDVDECESSPCEQRCTNNMGSFSCSCSEGFRYIPDVGEPRRCRLHCPHHKCPPICPGGPGGPCHCADGFLLNEGTCEDLDECTMDRCEQGCVNTYGSFMCFCRLGFVPKDEVKCTVAAGRDRSALVVVPTQEDPAVKGSSASAGPFLWIWVVAAVVLVASVFLIRLYVVHRQKRREESCSQQGAAPADHPDL
uniref:Complement component C1q receptor n=1 Tax=Fundulus heteroclitus TaxID=8078 RepID=A0A3Q2QN69_FUNHE